MQPGRQHVRAPILTQVEATGPSLASLGRARDLSVGGILVETKETLPQGADVIVRFRIPPEPRPLEVVGRVVRSEAGQSMAIAFLGLSEAFKQRILSHIQEAQEGGAPAALAEPSELGVQRRRSGRIPRRVAIVLSWQDEAGRSKQEAAETKLLSRYGALLTSYSQLESGKILRLSIPERGKEANSRVVFSAMADLPGQAEVAVEFVGTENFWDMPFPADPATLLPTRRRSARLRKSTPVELSWEAAGGVKHTEAAESRELGRYGVRLIASNVLEGDRLLQVRRLDTGQQATARIVWRKPSKIPGRVDMGLEFLGTQDFWAINFPADRDYVPPDADTDTD